MLTAMIPAKDLTPGRMVVVNRKGKRVKSVDQYVPFRGHGEFPRPTIGKVWIKVEGESCVWVCDESDPIEVRV